MDKDALNAADFQRVGRTAMRILTNFQDFNVEDRVLGLALVFSEICDLYKMRPSEIMEIARRLTNEKAARSMELRAVHQYVINEMR